MGSCRVRGEIPDLRSMHEYDKSKSFFPAHFVLSKREGGRPKTMTCLPHAQITEQASQENFDELVKRANALVDGAANLGKSTVSMPSTYPAYHLKPAFGAMPKGAIMGFVPDAREFAHIHAKYLSEDDSHVQACMAKGLPWQLYQGGGLGSLHLTLSLRDAQIVMDAAWGEQHVLADKGVVSQGLLLVYAPRNEDEIVTVLKILEASLGFARSGQREV